LYAMSGGMNPPCVQGEKALRRFAAHRAFAR